MELKPLGWTAADAKEAYFGLETSPEVRCGQAEIVSFASSRRLKHKHKFALILHLRFVLAATIRHKYKILIIVMQRQDPVSRRSDDDLIH